MSNIDTAFSSFIATATTAGLNPTSTAEFIPTLIPAIIINGNTSSPTPTAMTESLIAPTNLIALLIILAAGVGALVLTFFFVLLLKQLYNAKVMAWPFEGYLIQYGSKALFILAPIAAILITLPLLNVDSSIYDPIRHALLILFIAACTYAALMVVKAAQAAFNQHEKELEKGSGMSHKSADTSEKTSMLPPKQDDTDSTVANHRARTIQTQIVVFARFADSLVIAIGFASVVLTFPSAYNFGTSILASAGVAGIVVSMAAKDPLGSMVASLQIAITQPILLDDFIVVDGEQGYVEEIQSQYVVIRSRGMNRIIIPITRFTEGSFENWSRTDRGGKITSFQLYVDYNFPISKVRKALDSFVKKCPYSDGRISTVIVSDAQPTFLQLTVRISAPSIEYSFVLQDAAREYLVGVIGRGATLPNTPTQVQQHITAALHCDSPDASAVTANLEYRMLLANGGLH